LGKKSRNKRLAREQDLLNEVDNSKSFYRILNWIVYISLSLIIVSIILYIDTVISLGTIWATALISGVITSFILLFKFSKCVQPYWQTIMTGLLVGGSLSTFILIAPNYFINENKESIIEVDIISSGNKTQRRSKCKTPFVVVIVDKVEKELTFSCSYESTIKNYKSVRLTLSKGLWGFLIIGDKDLR
jgi:hypothetical protein